jgi:hypothetical protein
MPKPHDESLEVQVFWNSGLLKDVWKRHKALFSETWFSKQPFFGRNALDEGI